MKSLSLAPWMSLLFIMQLHVQGQVPSLIHFQGRLAREQQAFRGAGEFKFSLVSSNGSATFWSNDGTGQQGHEPSNAVPVLVHGGLFSVTLGDTALPNMTPVSPLVFTNTDVRLRIWFRETKRERKHGFDKDDRHEDDEDDKPEDKHPRKREFELLTPDQRITSVGYAMFAANVSDGAITSAKLANGAVTREKLAPDAFPVPVIEDGSILTRHLAENSVTTSKLADGAVTQDKLATGSVGSRQLIDHAVGSNQLAAGAALANLMASRQSGVAVGGVILSFDETSPALESAGFTRSGSLPVNPERWETRTGPAPTLYPRIAVWTGSEIVVASTGDRFQGARYDPRTDLWSPISGINAPSYHDWGNFLWTGEELITWGGYDYSPNSDGRILQDGFLYKPTTDRWRSMTTNNAPEGRTSATAVWTGSEMLVWGGVSGDGVTPLSNGGRYNPVRNEWSNISPVGSPAIRYNHTAIWSGDEMIVWGGQNRSSLPEMYSTGGRYRPENGTWKSLPTLGAPPATAGHNAIWTGTEMIVWGGRKADGTPARTGGRFNPADNSWHPLSTLNAPEGRVFFSAVWTGREMIVWGGGVNEGGDPFYANGGRYDPVADKWFPLATDTAPAGRYLHHGFWLGDGMLILGGDNRRYEQNPVMYIWRPAQSAYLYQRR